VTFGIHPTRPATSYGYIRAGEPLSDGVFAVDAFFEKPDAEHAASYINKNYLWNSGNFAFRSDVMLQEITKYEPNIATAARAAVAGLNRDIGFIRLASEPFEAAPTKSIDHAIMERTTLAAVVPTDMGWSDIGSWNAVWDNVERDSDGNSLGGTVATIDSHNNLIRSDDGILTAVVGIQDAIIVTTADAVLVVAKSRAEDVKTLVAHLNARKMRVAAEHRRMFRPWGYYQGIDIGDRYQVKRIVVKPGACLSLQKHFHRAEHWVVVRGTAEVTLGEAISIVHENESIYIPIGSKHRLANPGKIALELIEVQVGSYLGEDDIERFEDTYGRGP
jgi:mannose-1-phosphate guanylyltransferase/mannose-6-phosphate isomerase